MASDIDYAFLPPNFLISPRPVHFLYRNAHNFKNKPIIFLTIHDGFCSRAHKAADIRNKHGLYCSLSLNKDFRRQFVKSASTAEFSQESGNRGKNRC